MDYEFLKSDQVLFHYTQVSTLFEGIFNSCSLRFPPLINMNDPYEYRDYYFTYSDMTDKLSPESVLKLVEMGKYLNTCIRQKIKATCFCINQQTEDSTNYGYQRSRMWTQFGDDHRGICLVFSKNSLLEKCLDTFPIVFHGGMYYKHPIDLLPSVNYQKLKDKSVFNQYVFEYLTAHQNILLFQKDVDYKDENEYRIYIMQDKEFAKCKDNYLYLPIQNSLSSIIIGDRFHKSYLPLLLHFSKKYHFDCFKTQYINGQCVVSPI